MIGKNMKNSSEIIAGRDIGIDIMKCLAAFLVICIHCPFPGRIGEYFITITRIAVPLFFMITGYYFPSIKKNNREKSQIIKIVLLVLKANILYFVWDIIYAIVLRQNILVYIKDLLAIKNIILFLTLNESPFAGHLWYLGALLYTLIFMHFISGSKFFKKKLSILLFLLIIDLTFGKYSLLLFGKEYSYLLVRNFAFVGIPYFTLGYLLNNYKIRVDIRTLYVTLVLFTSTSLLERLILVTNVVNAERDHYISTTFLAITIFLIFTTIKSQKNCYLENLVAKIGREYSTGIYIIHPIISMILTFLAKKMGVLSYFRYFLAVAVFIICVIFMAFYKTIIIKITSYGSRNRV